jgi:hypothetical protein
MRLIRFAFTFFLLGIISIADAQERNCKTFEMHEYLMETNPGYRHSYLDQFKSVLLEEENKRVAVNDTTYFIPVVVHVLYHPSVAIENISNQQISTQIDVLNEDYAALNANVMDVPDAWKNLITDSKIRFKLATQDPLGNYTTGITRTEVPFSGAFSILDPRIFSTASGGSDAWDPHSYLNIWVCELENGILGFAAFPGTNPTSDGVVINYKAFGRYGSAVKPYNVGRTTTHEVGHWLNLTHIWGDDGGACSNDDGITDTPLQANSSTRCTAFPKTDACTSVSPGIMFMNYMDYTDDKCMMFFTPKQIDRMKTTLATVRHTLKNSTGLSLPSINGVELSIDSIISPVKWTSNRCYSPTLVIENQGDSAVNNIGFVYGISGGIKRIYNYSDTIPAHSKSNITLNVNSGDEGDNIFEVTMNINDGNSVNNYKTSSFRINNQTAFNCSENAASNILIYPNPVKTAGSICVKTFFKESQEAVVDIVDATGRICQSQKMKINPNDIFPINTKHLSPGTYFVHISGDIDNDSELFLCIPDVETSAAESGCN